MKTIGTVRLDGFLSFAPGSEAFDLMPLNVLIGPNGAGKTNLLEAFDLLAATPTNLAAPVRQGGGVGEWLWKGEDTANAATVEVILDAETPTGRPLRYRLEFGEVQSRLEVIDETIEEVEAVSGHRDVYFYYRFQRGRPAINVREGTTRHLQREALLPDQSVLAQRKDPDQYPEITWLGKRIGSLRTFREWTIGRATKLRQPQLADLPEDALLPDCSNLALVLNQIEHRDGRRLNELLRRFFPRFERLSTRIAGGTVQFYLHESDFSSPVSAARISDGTLRFIAFLATLLAPDPPPLVCIEEPEIGLHPDAVSLAADLLVEASSRMQIVVTTHSDALVSALSNHVESIVVCERPGAGTVMRRLEAARLKDWLDNYLLGDLWRMGELGANP